MTNSPNSGQEPELRSTGRTRRRTLARIGFAVGGVLLVGAAVGAWWAWRFIHEKLAPLVSETLSETLNRPVEVGEVEGVSLTSISIGTSAVPATATDPDRITIPEVQVRFNPWELLWDRSLSLDVTLVNAEGYLEQDVEGLWIGTTLKEQEETEPFIKIELDTLRLRNSTLRLAPYIQPDESTAEADIPPTTEIVPESDPAPNDPASSGESGLPPPILVFNAVNGAATFRENNKLISFDVATEPETGGTVRVRGTADLRQHQVMLQVDSQDWLAADVGLLLPLPLKLQAGLLQTNLEVQLPIATDENPFAPSQLFFNGTVRFRDAVARLAALPKPFTQANGGLRFQGQRITMQEVRGRYGEIAANVGGSLHLVEGYALTAQAPSVTIANLLETFDVDEASIPIELSGEFEGELRITGAIDEPLLLGTANNTELVTVDRVTIDEAQTRFTITPEALTFNEIDASLAEGGSITGTGEMTFGDRSGLVFDLRATGIAGDPIAQAYGVSQSNITVGRVDATAQVFGSLDAVQTIVEWEAPQATYPGRGRVVVSGDRILFRDTVLLVAGGIVRGEGDVSDGRWQALIQGSGIELSQFSSELRGLFSGNFRLSGSLSDFSLASIQAEGEAAFSEGLAIINDRLTASVRWLGDRLQVLEASAPGFRGDGFIGVQVEGTPGIRNLDLTVQLRDYAITNLPIPIPAAVRVAGTTNFDGRVTGTIDAVTVAGHLGLNDLAVNELIFEPVLSGEFQYAAGQRLNLDVEGRQDQIAVQLDGQNRPVSFFIQQGDTIARGRGEGDRILAEVENFPLQALNLAPAAAYGLGEVSGRANGRFDINIADLSNPSVVGQVAIANPALGYIAADSFTAQFRYINGVAVLDEGELRQANSLYLISGSFNPGSEPLLQGKITAAPGRVEDILAALQVFELSDLGRGIDAPVYGTAADVETIVVGLPDATLLNQLRRLSEITALRDQAIAAREMASFLPDLSTVQGVLAGDIDIAFSTRTGVTLDFNLNGQNWAWGDYQVNQVIAQGGFEDGILTLRPLRFQSDQALLNFTGQVGGEQQSGQLIAENIPIEALRDLFRLPLDVEGGVLNANAFLSGSIGNPQVIGEVLLADATLNTVEAPPFRTLFGYNNARLEVESQVVGDEENLFRFTGSVPYRLPFMTVSPDNNDFTLDLEVRDNGLALVNLFTDQVTWKGGEGDVQLLVQGSLDTLGEEPQLTDLVATGNATFNNAQVGSRSLPEDITNIAGNIQFGIDRIRVETLQGQFSNGQVSAQGTLPLLVPLNPNNPNEERPLTVRLDNLALNLEQLYEGGVDGQVIIRGSAVAPTLGGQILLSNGQVSLPGGEESASPIAQTTDTEPLGIDNPTSVISPPEFRNLMLTLGDNLRVTQKPILSFGVAGDLLINGTFDNLRPEGIIRLRSGRVNIFTTQFNLASGYTSTAEFLPTRGLDPILDVQLVTSAPEVTRVPIAPTSPYPTSDVADVPSFDYGAIQTVRIQASVQGPASRIYHNLELSSSPRRTESEIIALLGGGFVSSLEQGDATGAIANLAGATVLTQLQNLISSATGLTDFRLFPATVLSEEERASTLALAAELGFDITDDLSFSILQILTVQEPTQFNLRYRLSDEFLLRGSTTLEGDSGVILEFQTRF
ncbi:MAG: translocation/assembly module TamB [Cyanobacteria bacterium CRU_2_1]|nr:translocation/assembly module TamB [Cyanobacteria bacterium CRU_2_1]